MQINGSLLELFIISIDRLDILKKEIVLQKGNDRRNNKTS